MSKNAIRWVVWSIFLVCVGLGGVPAAADDPQGVPSSEGWDFCWPPFSWSESVDVTAARHGMDISARTPEQWEGVEEIIIEDVLGQTIRGGDEDVVLVQKAYLQTYQGLPHTIFLDLSNTLLTSDTSGGDAVRFLNGVFGRSAEPKDSQFKGMYGGSNTSNDRIIAQWRDGDLDVKLTLRDFVPTYGEWRKIQLWMTWQPRQTQAMLAPPRAAEPVADSAEACPEMDGWTDIKWGMSFDEVQSIVGELSPDHVKYPESLPSRVQWFKSGIIRDGLAVVQVRFFDDKVASLFVSYNYDKFQNVGFEDLVARFSEGYGEPLEVEDMMAASRPTKMVHWKCGPGEIYLQYCTPYYASRGMIVLQIHSLDMERLIESEAVLQKQREETEQEQRRQEEIDQIPF